MKRYRIAVHIASLVLALNMIAIPVLATTSYIAYVPITNTSATDYSTTGAIVPINNSYLLANNFFSDSGKDVSVTNGSTTYHRMLTDNSTIFALPIPAHSTQTVQIATGQASVNFDIVTGHNGYITTTDNSTLYTYDNTTAYIEWAGYLDVTQVNGELLERDNGGGLYQPRVYISSVGTLTALDTWGYTWTTSISGLTSGYTTVSLNFTLTDVILTVGTSSNTTAVTGLLGTASAWKWLTGNIMPYCSYIKYYLGGVQTIWYQPASIITGTTLPNRTSANFPATITYGDLSYTVSSSSVSTTTGVTSITAGGTQGLIPVVSTPVNPADAAILANLAFDPLYTLFTLVNNLIPVGLVALYRFYYFLLALLFFLLGYMFTRHLAFSGIIPLFIWGYGMAIMVIPWYAFFVLLLMVLGLTVMEGRQSPR